MRARRTHPPTCRLYFTTFPHPPPKQETLNAPGFQTEPVNVRGIRTPPSESSEPIKHYYFTIDDQLMYMSFFQDWGPLNVAMVYKACIYIHSLLIVSPSYDVWPRTLSSGVPMLCDPADYQTLPSIQITITTSTCVDALGKLECDPNTAAPLLGLYYLFCYAPDYRGCSFMDAHTPFQDEDLASHRLILYTSDDPQRKANAALLIALFSVCLDTPPISTTNHF
jgi:hypothetical protein